MRTRRLSLFAFAAIAALATSCSNEELTTATPNQPGIVIDATADTPQGGADTRLIHTDGSASMNIVWATGDEFTVFGGGEQHNYTLEGDGGKPSGAFTMSGTWETPPTGNVYAIYPAIATATSPDAVSLTLEGQTGALAGLSDFNYMTASTTYSTDKLKFGTFSHQVAIVKLVLTLPDGVTATEATEVGLKATGLNKSTVLNLTTGAFSSFTAGDVTTGANTVSITDMQLTAYLCVLPGSLTDATAVATVGSDNYEAALSDLTIAAGNMYTATVMMAKQAPSITWAPGNLVANGANGCKVGAPEDGGLYFQFGSLIGWAGGASGDGTGVPVSNSPGYAFNATGTVVPSGKSIPATWGDPDRWTGGTSTADVVPAANDPCTHYLGSGWRLPTTDEYKALFNNVTNNEYESSGGWSWTNSPASATHTDGKKFPASGFRYYDDGSLGRVGTDGSYWSASPYDATSGYSLTFGSSDVTPDNYYDRALGLPVRCVQNASN